MFDLNLLPDDIIDLIVGLRLTRVSESLLLVQRFVRRRLEQRAILLDMLDYSPREFEFCYTHTVLKMFGRLRWLCPEETEELVLVKVDCYFWYDYGDQLGLAVSEQFGAIKALLVKQRLNLYAVSSLE